MRDIVTIPLIALAVLFGIGKFVPEKQSTATPANDTLAVPAVDAKPATATAPAAKAPTDATPGFHWADVKVCNGRTCHIERRLLPNIPSKAAKVLKAACPCNCPDCTCNKQTSQPSSCGSCQSGTTSTRRAFRSGGRFFGRGCCR